MTPGTGRPPKSLTVAVTVFWPSRPFQYSYVSLLRAAHTAIKHADPGAKVVLGGMPNYSWLSLKSIYRIRGARMGGDRRHG